MCQSRANGPLQYSCHSSEAIPFHLESCSLSHNDQLSAQQIKKNRVPGTGEQSESELCLNVFFFVLGVELSSGESLFGDCILAKALNSAEHL